MFMIFRIVTMTLAFLCVLAVGDRAEAAPWCIIEYAKEQAQTALTLQKVSEDKWDDLIKGIAKSLNVPPGVKSIPCSHGRQVYAYQFDGSSEVPEVPPGGYIVYDPLWLTQVVGDDESEAVFLFGHEFGHFVGRHFADRSRISEMQKELEADEFGACAAAKQGHEFSAVKGILNRLRPIKADGKYPSREDAISAAEAKYIECGGLPPKCGDNAWYICPLRKYSGDWRVDLMFMMVTITDDEVSTKTLELRTNISETEIARLAAINEKFAVEPSGVYLEIRHVESGKLPDNLALGDFTNFTGMDADTKREAISGIYERYKRAIGNGSMFYNRKTNQSHGIEVSFGEDDIHNYWSLTTRAPSLESPVKPGDSVLFLKEFTAPIDDNSYFLGVDFYGYMSPFHIDNGFIILNSLARDYEFHETGINTFVLRKDGKNYPEYGLKVFDKSDDSIVLYHQDIEGTSSVRVNFRWIED